MTTIFFQFQLL